MAKGPLSRVRVLDMSRILAGPWAAQMLADLGAEVIKIERPGKGDDSRQFGPPFLKDAEGRNTRESSFYISTNRNKKIPQLRHFQARGASADSCAGS